MKKTRSKKSCDTVPLTGLAGDQKGGEVARKIQKKRWLEDRKGWKAP
jgi:hypothetical protein